MATSKIKSKTKKRSTTHSTARAVKNKPRSARAAVGNTCDDQNGLVVCWGGRQTNVPFPTSGGPWAVTVAQNAQTGMMEVQFADLSTLCPGALPSSASTGCRDCGDHATTSSPSDVDPSDVDPSDPPTESDQP